MEGQHPCSCSQAAVPRTTQDSAHGHTGALPWVYKYQHISPDACSPLVTVVAAS